VPQSDYSDTSKAREIMGSLTKPTQADTPDQQMPMSSMDFPTLPLLAPMTKGPYLDMFS
jgi:hypothetical protein